MQSSGKVPVMPDFFDGSMPDFWFKDFGLLNHLLKAFFGRYPSAKSKFFIGFHQFLVKVFGLSRCELPDRVYPRGFQQFRKLCGNAFNPEKVCVIDPGQYQ
jgi:hypothetical protein